MNWQQFIEHLESAGFTGDGEDFPIVQTWLKENGHNTEKVSSKAGEMIDLKQLFEDRQGKMLDVSKAAEKAAETRRIDDAVVVIMRLAPGFDEGGIRLHLELVVLVTEGQ